jgi:serine/threonine-protein kinase
MGFSNAAAALSAAIESASAFDHGRFLPGTILADRYRIVALVGRGGMGEVYRADDLKLQQSVALKFLPESLALRPSALARFHNEVRISRQITHPNVCRVYDIGECDGMHFLSMEFVQGEDLATLLRRIGKLPYEKAVEMARQLAAGLAAAHEAGVVHQDLKPANVLIDAQGRVRITDFGVSEVASRARESVVIAGTPAYMAPEQLAGKGTTIQSDLYALGLVLYEIFTGKPLHDTPTGKDATRVRDPNSSQLIGPALQLLDPAIERVVARCIEEDPQRRPVSAMAVLAALPGGDPLAAAVASGHTPSPEMVAAAGGVGALSARKGGFLLTVTLMGMVVLAVLNNFATDVTRRIPVSIHPAILADRASEFLRQWYPQRPFTAYGLDWDHDYAEWAARTQNRPAPSGGGYFWYRESSVAVLPNFPVWEPSLTDPAPIIPGMITAVLDAKGRLLRFSAVSSPMLTTSGEGPQVNWSPFIAKAGFSQGDLQVSSPIANPPTSFDRRYAWTGQNPEDPDMSIRIEAASLEGKPVYFAVLRPWELPTAGTAPPIWTLAHESVEATGFLIRWAALAIAAVLVIRNLRRGRADRRGALRIAIYIAAVSFVAIMLRARHGGLVVSEVYRLNTMIGYCLQAALSCWVLYMALEPYVRREWPQLLISLSRLLGGQVTDPLVGRDVLAGMLCAVAVMVPFTVLTLVGQHYGFTFPRGLLDKPMANVSLRETLGILLWYPFGDSIFTSLLDLFVLVAALGITRNRRLALPIFAILEFLLTFGLSATGSSLTAGAIVAAILSAGLVFTLVRFGVLAMMAAIFCGYVLLIFPLTFDLSVWYAPNAWLATAVVVGIAIYAFHLATRGRWMTAG